ncbi:MAG TPA: patatin-like phospholipase family protein [Campylobacterales bacterium]|nr:patatin-like phospholipase family protein [Campylobacterales bacterium]
MRHLSRVLLSFFLLSSLSLAHAKDQVNLSMVISGGVSLGAYEAGYNWAMIKMLSNIKQHSQLVDPKMRSVTGASAGSINALLSAMYWCQRDDVTTKNRVNDNLFYDTWVKLGLEDLIIEGHDTHNKSTLFSRDELRIKAQHILEHLDQPIYEPGCEVPLGFTVTKSKPMITEFSGIPIKNQHFSVPLTLYEQQGRIKLKNRTMPPSSDYFLAIPGIEHDNSKIRDVLFASSAFPGAFEQVKLDYLYEGKAESAYFIDGGAYDNLPLQLAKELDNRAADFLFIDPDNMRKEAQLHEEEEETPPIGFLSSNAIPLVSAVDIFKSMRLYSAIHQYFGEHSTNSLILSSRYHPITGQFLGAFGAFLNEDFRIYDYYVGVYDAIYHLSESMHERGYFLEQSQERLMNRLKHELGIDNHPEARQAYRLFFDTEFKGVKHPKTDNKFAAIYNAFNHDKQDTERYDITEFDLFLSKLDMRQIKNQGSYIPADKEELNAWYKKPLSLMINRISTLENDYAKVEGNSQALAKITNMMAWMGNNMVKQKEGFEPFPLNIPKDPSNPRLARVLRALPNELTSDVKNGGIGLAYNAYWHQKKSWLDAIEGKLSLNQSDDISSFVRMDINTLKEYQGFLRVGVGGSLFGNLESSFYDKEGLYGINTYVDILDIFRLTYVRRFDHPTERDYIYFGIRNLPSLIYWLRR